MPLAFLKREEAVNFHWLGFGIISLRQILEEKIMIEITKEFANLLNLFHLIKVNIMTLFLHHKVNFKINGKIWCDFVMMSGIMYFNITWLGLIKINNVSANFNNPRPLLILTN